MVNSAGDWGHSDPLAVPELIFEMRRRGHADALIRKVVYENPLTFLRRAPVLILSSARRSKRPERFENGPASSAMAALIVQGDVRRAR